MWPWSHPWFFCTNDALCESGAAGEEAKANVVSLEMSTLRATLSGSILFLQELSNKFEGSVWTFQRNGINEASSKRQVLPTVQASATESCLSKSKEASHDQNLDLVISGKLHIQEIVDMLMKLLRDSMTLLRHVQCGRCHAHHIFHSPPHI